MLILNEIPTAQYLIIDPYIEEQQIKSFNNFYLRIAIRLVATKMELDDNFNFYENYNSEHFSNDIIYYRLYYIQCKDYPSIKDTQYFSNYRKICKEIVNTQRQYIDYLTILKDFTWDKESIQNEIEYCQYIIAVYDNCEYACSPDEIIVHRRESLKILKDLIGTGNYLKGQLPYP